MVSPPLAEYNRITGWWPLRNLVIGQWYHRVFEGWELISSTSCMYKCCKASYFPTNNILCLNTMAKRRNPYKGISGRKKTLVKKAHKLGQLPGVEVALFIRRRGRVTAYRSIDDESWWPVKADIVSRIDRYLALTNSGNSGFRIPAADESSAASLREREQRAGQWDCYRVKDTIINQKSIQPFVR